MNSDWKLSSANFIIQLGMVARVEREILNTYSVRFTKDKNHCKKQAIHNISISSSGKVRSH